MGRALELTAQELVNKFSKITNSDTALWAVAQSVLEKLGEDYLDVKIIKKDCDGFFDVVFGEGYKGYSIQEKKELPEPIVERRIWRFVKTRTHDTRELCSVQFPYSVRKQKELFVRVNEKPVIDACEKIAERTGGNVSVRYTF